MVVSQSSFSLFFWGGSAFLLSLFLELLLKPRTSLCRPLFAWLCQFGLWAILYSLLVLLLGRPICAAGAALAFYLVLVLVSNAKYASLREPFLYQDYDYFLDVIRFPRLYLPFLGIRNFTFCALGCFLAIGGLLLENSPADRFSFHGQAGAALVFLGLGILCLATGNRLRTQPSFRPLEDYKKFGFPTFLYLYSLDGSGAMRPLSSLAGMSVTEASLPHLIAIQSESFFDLRLLDPGLAPDVLHNLDQLQKSSFLHGFLQVPAWGANTVRTEFAFLTGIEPASIGSRQFNPYRAMLGGWLPESLPAFLKSLGYQTICLHPWHAAFYGRKRLFPQLGFDNFLELKDFADCPKSGAYTDDRWLADKLLQLLERAKNPIFAFVITMENHGPLKLTGNKAPLTPFRASWREDCPELPDYLEHLIHADLMLARLHDALSRLGRPASLCFYGDHVPIMPCTYKALGYPEGETPYFCWSNRQEISTPPQPMQAWRLARAWLAEIGLIQDISS